MSALKVTARLIALGLTALLLTACGTTRPPVACTMLDASASATYAQPEYLQKLRTDLQQTAASGERAVVVVANGEPLVEAAVMQQSFSGLVGTEKSGERDTATAAFADEIQTAARRASSGVQNPTRGSGILAGIDLLGRQGCAAITALSDGLEYSRDMNILTADITTAAGRKTLVDRLAQRGRIPSLHGVKLVFPFGGYVPQGIKLSPARVDALPLFWQAYADRAGATLRWER